MINDELLHDLLSKASSLYNSGEYQGAIQAWKEALKVDPSSRKAAEGIRMASLLLTDDDLGEEPSGPEEAGNPAADGAPPGGAGASPEQLEEMLDAGIARVKELLAERKFQDAIEGAKGLLPIDPESETVQRLIEEAQQAYESAPFIEEQVTLTKELMAQERFDEAEALCKKVFILDPTNREARSLVKIIRAGKEPAEEPAEDLLPEVPPDSGQTMKMKMPPAALKKKPAAAPPDEGGEDEPAAFDLSMEDLPAVEEETPVEAELPLEAEPPADEPEIVEARTKVPPSVRLVPRTPPQESAKPAGKKPASVPVSSAQEPDLEPLPKETGAADDPMAWETELAQLNLKEEESDILRSGGDDASAALVDGDDAGLMSLLDADLNALTTESPGADEAASPSPGAEKEPGHPEPAVAKPAPARKPAGPEASAGRRPSTSPAAHSAAAGKSAAAAEPRAASSVPKYFVLLGVVILALAAAGWWFFFQPRSAGGNGSPAAPAAPPGGAPSGGAVAAPGPIPTPIGGGSRQASQPSRTSPDLPESQPPDGSTRPDGSQAPDGAAPAAAAMTSQGSGTTPGPDARQAAGAGEEPDGGEREIQGPPKPLPPEEVHRRVAAAVAEGRRLMAQQKWKEASTVLQAAVALDPFDFQIKELFDQAQGKLDEETRLNQDFKQAAALFADKDYQNALWKLYRLPRDRGLGDIDLYIRNAWFNWAVIALRAGDATDALQKLSENLSVDSQDAEALKLQEFTQRYANRAKDRMYFGVVETLRFRNMDQR